MGRPRKRKSNNRLLVSTIAKMKKGMRCLICDESRALEVAHLIPVYITNKIAKFTYLGYDKRNTVILCKNHHYLLDKKLLNNQELEAIYSHSREFINQEMFEFINSDIKYSGILRPTGPELSLIKRFENWLSWVSRVFYVAR